MRFATGNSPGTRRLPLIRAALALAVLPALAVGAYFAVGIGPSNWYRSLLTAGLSGVVATGIASTALAAAIGLLPLRRAFSSEQCKVQTLLNAVPEGVFEVDCAGRILFVNDQGCDLFGYPREELVGQSIDVLVPPQHRGHHAQRREGFFAGSRSRAMGTGLDIMGMRRDGSQFAVDISLSRLESSRGVTIYCLVRDNSVRKAFEQQLVESNRKLLASVATLERNARELRQLTELGDLLHSSNTEQELLQIAARTMSRLMPGHSGALYTLKDARANAEVMAAWGAGASDLRPAIFLDDCWGLRRGRLHGCTAADDEPRCRHCIDERRRPSQCLPLLGHHGELLGGLHLFAQDFDDARELADPARLQFLQALAGQMALSLANLRLRETLRTQSLVDPLTGLYNRRVVNEWFEKETRAAAQNARPLSLLIVDIDHFKTFNDRFGHQCGDVALQAIGAQLRQCLRHEDLVCRWGGEEFVALLAEAGLEDAEKIADKLRRSIEGLQLNLPVRPPPQVTVSIGVATLGAHGTTVSQLVRQADRALYRAKAAGRNRVSLAVDPESTGLQPVLSLPSRRA